MTDFVWNLSVPVAAAPLLRACPAPMDGSPLLSAWHVGSDLMNNVKQPHMFNVRTQHMESECSQTIHRPDSFHRTYTNSVTVLGDCSVMNSFTALSYKQAGIPFKLLSSQVQDKTRSMAKTMNISENIFNNISYL